MLTVTITTSQSEQVPGNNCMLKKLLIKCSLVGVFILPIGRVAMILVWIIRIDIRRNALRLLTPYGMVYLLRLTALVCRLGCITLSVYRECNFISKRRMGKLFRVANIPRKNMRCRKTINQLILSITAFNVALGRITFEVASLFGR